MTLCKKCIAEKESKQTRKTAGGGVGVRFTIDPDIDLPNHIEFKIAPKSIETVAYKITEALKKLRGTSTETTLKSYEDRKTVNSDSSTLLFNSVNDTVLQNTIKSLLKYEGYELGLSEKELLSIMTSVKFDDVIINEEDLPVFSFGFVRKDLKPFVFPAYINIFFEFNNAHPNVIKNNRERAVYDQGTRSSEINETFDVDMLFIPSNDVYDAYDALAKYDEDY